jgi:tRNA (guanine37-N1)-methyltransferase
VPEVLLSGDHGKVEKWRREQALQRTFKKRPDMIEKAELSEKENKFIEGLREKENPPPPRKAPGL